MKPKPLVALNHLTVPVCMGAYPYICVYRAARERSWFIRVLGVNVVVRALARHKVAVCASGQVVRPKARAADIDQNDKNCNRHPLWGRKPRNFKAHWQSVGVPR